MGNSQSEGEKALDNTLAAQAGQMRPTTEQITELWDAYDKNKDGILVSVARSARGRLCPVCALLWCRDCRGTLRQEPLWPRG